ncbi:MAG: T9SS type A sorting domain-containing protein, partial [Ignavibacteriaceae bacterium]|nr:T9SS type A sorting domain-containing protein [Ignavibacteriaceae bacterium]
KAYKPNKPFKPVADFSADSNNIVAGQSINFFDQSSFLPTNWQWSFPGGFPSSSTDQNPQNILYNTPGVYDVSLIATNAMGNDTLIKTCYIEVEQASYVEDSFSPEDFYLFQNYPNPFNPTTTLSYVIGHSSFVSLKVYDVLGNEVATLVNEDKLAGNYEVQFVAAGLTSGIYFYKLMADNFVQTRKMILLK